MTESTVRELASIVGIPVDKLMQQLDKAGLKIKDADQHITKDEKLKLLGFLRESHGKEAAEINKPARITLKRKTVSQLTVAGNAGRSKKIDVQVKRSRTYVRRSEILEQDKLSEDRQDAAKALAESQEKAKLEVKQQEEKQQQVAEQAALKEETSVTADTNLSQETKKPLENQESNIGKSVIGVAKTKPVEKNVEKSDPQADKKSKIKEDKPKSTDQNLAKKPQPKFHKPVVENKPRIDTKIKSIRRSRTSEKRSTTSVLRPEERMLKRHGFSKPIAPKVKEIQIPETITVAELAQKLAIKSGEVIKVMMGMGEMATINQVIDQETAILVVEEMGHKATQAVERDIEAEVMGASKTSTQQGTTVRPPVVTVMGHVDHGKTSLLDYIRRTKVVDKEAGGITQHIGAYHVETDHGVVSFLDTPGHAAFTAMRARGAKLTDIVVLVVAADDGAKPQTVEAIQHARAAKVPIIVAITKIDKPEADIDKVKTDLSSHEVIPEDWGGEEIFVNVSSKNGEGIEELLDAILLQAEVMELKATPDLSATGIVVESSLEKGRGPVATVLVQDGTLKKGDIILCGNEYGRVRAMFDESGKTISSAGPSMPAVVLGLSAAPNAGDDVISVENERKAREVAELRKEKIKSNRLAEQRSAKLDNLFQNVGDGQVKVVNLVVKADVQGSVGALCDALIRLSNEEVKVNVVAKGVGGITESDANLALTSNAIVIGFNVRADNAARKIISENELDLHYYSIIYDAIDEVKKAILGILGTETKEEIIGLAEVKDVFRSSKIGSIAGCIVVDGVVRRNAPIRVLRDNVVIFEGELESLRRYKDEAEEVKSGVECGIGVKQYNDVKAGDQIECFERVEVARTL